MEYLLNGLYALLVMLGIAVTSFLLVATLIVGVVGIAALLGKVVSLVKDDKGKGGR
jgi:hypothetical protein